MHFAGTLTTQAPPAVSDPTKEDTELKGQEDSERLPWKLPVIIGGPIVIVLSKPRFPVVSILYSCK